MSGRIFLSEKTNALSVGKIWAKGNNERLKLIRQFDEEKYPFVNYFDDTAWVEFRALYGSVGVLEPLVSFMDWLFGMDIENRMMAIVGDKFFLYKLLRDTLKLSVSERLEYFCLKTESGLTKYLDDLGYEPSDSDIALFIRWREGMGLIIKEYAPNDPMTPAERAFLSPPEAFDERFF